MASLSETLGDLTDLKVAGYFLETIMTIIKMVWQRPGGTPHMKGVGMLVGNFELNP